MQAQASKRLILKDGSYQPASRWEVKGDRVRYFSTERNDWEEVPASLVDWKATDDYAKQFESERAIELKRTEDEEAADAKAELAATPSVAPGIHLPNAGGVFLLEAYRGEPQLAELPQTGGELNSQNGRNVLRGVFNPSATAKHSIELKGEHARIQSHNLQPAIFLAVDPDPKSQTLLPAERFRIVRLEQKKDSRLVMNLKVGLTGKVSQQEAVVATKVEKLADNWVKLEPVAPVPPGEYAVVEMLSPKEMNLYVWDFGVNPSAPENAGAEKSAPAQPLPGATAPTLEKR